MWTRMQRGSPDLSTILSMAGGISLAGWLRLCHLLQMRRSEMPDKQANGEARGKFVFASEWYDDLFGLEDGESFDDAFWSTIQDVQGAVNKLLSLPVMRK
ncbi:hypothetical protein P4S72_29160 [Vibrio sp. PP-XX7]